FVCIRGLCGRGFSSFENRGISARSAAAELLDRLTANYGIGTELGCASARIAVRSLPTGWLNMRATPALPGHSNQLQIETNFFLQALSVNGDHDRRLGRCFDCGTDNCVGAWFRRKQVLSRDARDRRSIRERRAFITN